MPSSSVSATRSMRSPGPGRSFGSGPGLQFAAHVRRLGRTRSDAGADVAAAHRGRDPVAEQPRVRERGRIRRLRCRREVLVEDRPHALAQARVEQLQVSGLVAGLGFQRETAPRSRSIGEGNERPVRGPPPTASRRSARATPSAESAIRLRSSCISCARPPLRRGSSPRAGAWARWRSPGRQSSCEMSSSARSIPATDGETPAAARLSAIPRHSAQRLHAVASSSAFQHELPPAALLDALERLVAVVAGSRAARCARRSTLCSRRRAVAALGELTLELGVSPLEPMAVEATVQELVGGHRSSTP